MCQGYWQPGRNGCRQWLCPPDSLSWVGTGEGRSPCSNSPWGPGAAECRDRERRGKRSIAGRGSWPGVRGCYEFEDLGKGKHDQMGYLRRGLPVRWHKARMAIYLGLLELVLACRPSMVFKRNFSLSEASQFGQQSTWSWYYIKPLHWALYGNPQ